MVNIRKGPPTRVPTAAILGLSGGAMQDPASGLRRISLPRTRVNRAGATWLSAIALQAVVVAAKKLDVVGIGGGAAPRPGDDVIVLQILRRAADTALAPVAHRHGYLYFLWDGSRTFWNGPTTRGSALWVGAPRGIRSPVRPPRPPHNVANEGQEQKRTFSGAALFSVVCKAIKTSRRGEKASTRQPHAVPLFTCLAIPFISPSQGWGLRSAPACYSSMSIEAGARHVYTPGGHISLP
jgi:hypothetical protein